ncbi:MAG: acetolactate synthase small subunit [Gammaproteobacteria bacterium]|nr:acetolactate synthase small subunit [Gammaproteobacteria bacterium]
MLMKTDEVPHAGKVVLELNVRNHPGVMSHVCGLFTRRAFNVDGIVCMPVSGTTNSRIWLLVNDDDRLQQMERQLEKLEDVFSLHHHRGTHAVFDGLKGFFLHDQS